jgi:type IV fimbrial biogenesis protein FimT
MHNLKIKGFTLMELMITIGVLAVIISLAVPSFKETIERRHLEGAASSIHLGLQRAKSEAVKQNRNVAFDFSSDSPSSWCFGVVDTAGALCDCTDATPSCTVNTQAVVVDGSEFDNVTLTSASDVTFDGVVGLPTVGTTYTYTVELNGKTRTVTVNAAGLITTN